MKINFKWLHQWTWTSIDSRSGNSTPYSSTNQKHQYVETIKNLGRSQRVEKGKYFASDLVSLNDILFLVEGSRGKALNKIPIVLNIRSKIRTFKEAMSSRDSALWKKVINDEMNSLLSNTRVLVDLPPKLKLIGCKRVFRIKYKHKERVKKKLLGLLS